MTQTFATKHILNKANMQYFSGELDIYIPF